MVLMVVAFSLLLFSFVPSSHFRGACQVSVRHRIVRYAAVRSDNPRYAQRVRYPAVRSDNPRYAQLVRCSAVRQSTLRITCPIPSHSTIHVTHKLLSDTQPSEKVHVTQNLLTRKGFGGYILHSEVLTSRNALHCNCSQDIGLPSDRQRQVNCKTKCTIITSKHHKAIF